MICLSNKKYFRFLYQAVKRAKKINIENSKKGDPKRLRPYDCPYCDGFHLTSMSKSSFDKRLDKMKKLQLKRVDLVSEFWESKFK